MKEVRSGSPPGPASLSMSVPAAAWEFYEVKDKDTAYAMTRPGSAPDGGVLIPAVRVGPRLLKVFRPVMEQRARQVAEAALVGQS